MNEQIQQTGQNMSQDNIASMTSHMGHSKQNSQNGFNQNPYINDSNNASSAQFAQNPHIGANANLMSQAANNANTFDTANFLKGALIGALGAYLLTNENAQKTIFKGFSKGSQIFQAGFEEMKERFEDAKAEMDEQR